MKIRKCVGLIEKVHALVFWADRTKVEDALFKILKM